MAPRSGCFSFPGWCGDSQRRAVNLRSEGHFLSKVYRILCPDDKRDC